MKSWIYYLFVEFGRVNCIHPSTRRAISAYHSSYRKKSFDLKLISRLKSSTDSLSPSELMNGC